MRGRNLAAMLAILVTGGGALAQVAPCPAPAPPPPELAGWTAMQPLAAGANPADAAMLTPGMGARATLLPVGRIVFAPSPEREPDATSHGGVFALTVTEAGRYRVALGVAAWIDLIASGRPLASVAHGHGPDCSGIRKMVDFDLRPGRYLLNVSGSPQPTLPLLITRLPG